MKLEWEKEGKSHWAAYDEETNLRIVIYKYAPKRFSVTREVWGGGMAGDRIAGSYDEKTLAAAKKRGQRLRDDMERSLAQAEELYAAEEEHERVEEALGELERYKRRGGRLNPLQLPPLHCCGEWVDIAHERAKHQAAAKKKAKKKKKKPDARSILRKAMRGA